MTTRTMQRRSKLGLEFSVLAAAITMVLGLSVLSAPLLAQDDAQDDAQAEDNAELEALKEKAAILEQELKILQTENQLIEARFGKPATPLDGKIETGGDAPIESQVLAYRAVDEIAGEIATAVAGQVAGKPVVIYDAAQVTAVQSYVAFIERLKLLEAEYDNALPGGTEFVEAAGIVSGFASSVAGVLALFRTDVNVTSKTLSIDDLALAAAVANRLTGTAGVYHPALVPPGFATPPVPPPLDPNAPEPADMSDLLARLHRLDMKRQLAEEEVKRLTAEIGRIQKQIAKLDKEIAELKKKGDNDAVTKKEEEKAGKSRQLAALNAAKKGLETVNTMYQTIRNGLIAGGNNTTAMLGLLTAERVSGLLASGAPLLHLKMAAASGTTQTSNNLFAGSRLRHSGGAIATYVLFEAGGKILKSGNAIGRQKPVQFKKWKD